jgi:hypothetical protein
MEKMDSEIYSQMQTGKPLKTYKKTILGKVSCTVLNPFNNEVEGIILHGDPRKNDVNSMIDVWNEMQDVFFRRKNKVHLEKGVLIPFVKPENIEELKPEPFADASDEQLVEILNSRYLSLLSSLNKCTTEAVLFRLIDKARELEKSEKIINTLNARLAEIQSGEIDAK